MKARKTILDAHAAKLADWEAEGLTLAQMQERLAGLGTVISLGRLSVYLQRQRSQSMRMELLSQISTGAQQAKEVEAAFGKNPAPEMNTLIKLHRVLILKLSTQGNADPKLLDLVTALTKAAMDYERLGLKREELELTRDRFEHLKTLAAQSMATAQVLDADMSPEARAQRIKEIYGRA